jgi:hypothetical protein
VDAYDLIPTVPSWKAPETPLEINVGESEASEDSSSNEDDAQAHWQRSTAAEMRSPLGKWHDNCRCVSQRAVVTFVARV